MDDGAVEEEFVFGGKGESRMVTTESVGLISSKRRHDDIYIETVVQQENNSRVVRVLNQERIDNTKAITGLNRMNIGLTELEGGVTRHLATLVM